MSLKEWHLLQEQRLCRYWIRYYSDEVFKNVYSVVKGFQMSSNNSCLFFGINVMISEEVMQVRHVNYSAFLKRHYFSHFHSFVAFNPITSQVFILNLNMYCQKLFKITDAWLYFCVINAHVFAVHNLHVFPCASLFEDIWKWWLNRWDWNWIHIREK